MRQARVLALITLSALAITSCSDGYVPPSGAVIIDGPTPNMPDPAGSAGVEISGPDGPLIEGGQPVTVSVRLRRAPTTAVTLQVSSGNPSKGQVSPDALTFSPESWSLAQELIVTPVDNDIADGDVSWPLRFSIQSEDASFAAESVAPLMLITVDNDVAPQLVATFSGAPITTEASGSASLRVVLSRQPSSEVLVPVRVDDPTEATASAASLSFTTLNWNLPQELVLTGIDDQLKDGDVRYSVTLGPANSADAVFNGIGPLTLSLTNLDGVCGNGVVDGQEACEPKPGASTDCDFGQRECMVCSAACEYVQGGVSGFCGDGVVQFEQGEECDEPTAPCPYGLMSCSVCGPRCTLIDGAPSGFCGDGRLQPDDEECDEPTTPCPYGQMSCMTCRSCARVPGQLTGFCGDGILQPEHGEQCDGVVTCAVAGTATCDSTCKADLSGCITFESVAAGGRHTCALRSDSSVICRGSNTSQQQPTITSGVISIAADGQSTCLSTLNGVSCYGEAQGRVSLSGAQAVMEMTSFASTNVVPTIYEATLCGLSPQGQARCSTNVRQSWLSADTPTGVFTDIAVGIDRACALRASGLPLCWGLNNNDAPAVAMNDISGGSLNFCGVVASDGSIRCWGDSLSASLVTSTPQSVGFTALDVGVTPNFGEYGCAVSPQGLTCWGARPSNVPAFEAGHFTAVSAGREHVCAVRAGGDTTCWGSNSFNQHL